MVAKDRADEILEETPLRGPEDKKPGRVVLKEEGESKLSATSISPFCLTGTQTQ